MSVIQMPSGLWVSEQRIELRRFDLTEMSDVTGDSRTRLQAPPRWAVSIAGGAALEPGYAAQWESMLLKLRGRINHLAVFDSVKPVPRGTIPLTGLTLNASASAGATSIAIAGATGTLLEGDSLQIGVGVGASVYVKVVTDATASAGVITVTVEPPLRYAFSSGAAVRVNQPLIYCKNIGESVGWSGVTGEARTTGHAFDGLEAW